MDKSKVLETVDKILYSLDKGDFTIYFFIIDTKGNPNGSTKYIYELAKELRDLDYRVAFLHQEDEFVGVKDWMGEDYASLPHFKINSSNVNIAASDFLIIPEIFSSVMSQTKDLPCKRIVLTQNVNNITEFIPLGVSWDDYKITDVITTSQTQADDINELFPNRNIKIIPPEIPDFFNNQNPKNQNLVISILSKDQSITNKITKQFHWKFPSLRWVAFTGDINGFSQEEFAKILSESAITVWVDDDTYFGYQAVEAIKAGSILIGKIPDVIPEWMLNENKDDLINAGIWFNDMRDVEKIMASTVMSWMSDKVPASLYEEMDNFKNKFKPEDRKLIVKEVFDEYVENRKKEFTEIKNNLLKEETKD